MHPAMGPRPFPSLSLPFAASCNPYAHRLGPHLRRRVEEWTGEPEAGEQVVAARFHELVARGYPRARPRSLEVIGELIIWMFLFDDHFDVGRLGGDPARAEAAAGQVTSVAHGAAYEGMGPLMRALGTIMGRFEEMRPRLRPRIADDLGTFVASVAREVRQRTDRTVLSVDEYRAQRLETFAWDVLVDLVEFAHGSEMPERVRVAPEYRGVVRAAGTVMGSTNDLFSLRKELVGQESHNLVLILMRDAGLDLDEAVSAAESLVMSQVRTFLVESAALTELCERLSLLPRERATVDACVLGFRFLMRGQLDWCRTTDRYRTDTPHGGVGPAEAIDLLGPREA
jgi:hypothetical protein